MMPWARSSEKLELFPMLIGHGSAGPFKMRLPESAIIMGLVKKSIEKPRLFK